jgi:RHS repeat-associated protein
MPWADNALGRLTTVTFPNGNSKGYSYDAEAVIASTTDGLGNTATFTSDKMGRVTQASSPLGNVSQIGYDAMGRIVSSTDPLTQTTTFNRDSRGLLSGIELPGGVISTTYTRNSLGNITQITDPGGNNWQSGFNNQGLRTSRTDPLGNAQTVAYDNRNRPATITYADGVVQTLGYDPAGNMISRSYSGGGPVFNYSYDANNRLVSANDGPATPDNLTRSYDELGRINNSNGIAISRDAGGRIIGFTLAPGKSVAYAYDANDNLVSVTDWAGGVTTFSYDGADRLTGITRPAANGVDTTYIYDNDSRLVGIAEGEISSINLTRDANGQITAATRDVPQPASAGAPSIIAHSFDAASQTATAGFAYDARGRLTNDGTRTYTWDADSRLSSVNDGVAITYTYDALGRRKSRTSSGVSRDYVWNDALGLTSISVEVQAGADLRYFIHTPAGVLLYGIDAVTTTRSFYHFDEMGNSIFVTNDAGEVIGSYAFTPYGDLIASTGSLDNPHTWQSAFGVMDEGNGLYYLRARYYDGSTGRFISRDPVRSIGPKSITPYQYALGNPLRFVDPSGTEPSPEDIAVAKAEADVAKAEADVANAEADVANAEAKVAAAERGISYYEALADEDWAMLKIAESYGDARSMRRAFNQSDSSESEVHFAKTRLWLARSMLRRYRGDLTRERAGEATARRKKLNEAQAELEQARDAFHHAIGIIESVVPELAPIVPL